MPACKLASTADAGVVSLLLRPNDDLTVGRAHCAGDCMQISRNQVAFRNAGDGKVSATVIGQGRVRVNSRGDSRVLARGESLVLADGDELQLYTLQPDRVWGGWRVCSPGNAAGGLAAAELSLIHI